MTGFWKLLEQGGEWLVLLVFAGGGTWLATHVDSGLAAHRQRRERRIQHQEELRRLELEAKRRELEIRHPELVKPICGCGHDLAFHNAETSTCHYVAETNDQATTTPHLPHMVREVGCGCQGYTGPDVVGRVSLGPL